MLKEKKLLNSPKDICDFVNHFGFVLCVRVKDIPLINLWDSIKNPDWELTIGPWLDQLIKRRQIIYPLILKNKACIVSREFFLYFYKIQSQALDLEKYPIKYYYEKGLISPELKKIVEALNSGSKGVGVLRKVSGLEGRMNKSKFDRVMLELKKALAIIKIDTGRGVWGENIFALTKDVFSDQIKSARRIPLQEAYYKIIQKYLNLYNTLDPKLFLKIFPQNKIVLESVFTKLLKKRSSQNK